MRTFMTGVLVVAAVLGVTWILVANDLVLTGVFAPKYEQVRRQTFEQSKAYRQGMAQELENLQTQYLGATNDVQRDAVASIVRHRTADVADSDLPDHLRTFVREMRLRRTP